MKLIKSQSGSAILGAIFAVSIMTASFYLASNYVIQHRKINVEFKALMSYRLALSSVLDYSIYALRHRFCLTNDFLNDPNLCDYQHAKNLERLIMSNSQVSSLIAAKEVGAYTKTLPSEIVLSEVGGVIKNGDITSVSHPLFVILKEVFPSDAQLKSDGENVVSKIRYSFKRDSSSNLPQSGKEVFVRVKVEFLNSKDEVLIYAGKPVAAETLIGIFPRELGTYALLIPGSLRLDGITGDNGDIVFRKYSGASNWPGIKFKSPVYVNNNIYLPEKSSDGMQAPVLFAEKITQGNGKIYQGSNEFSPEGSLSDLKKSTWSNIDGIRGFARGIDEDGYDDPGMNVFKGGPPATPILDDQKMQKCISYNYGLLTNHDPQANALAQPDVMFLGLRETGNTTLKTPQVIADNEEISYKLFLSNDQSLFRQKSFINVVTFPASSYNYVYTGTIAAGIQDAVVNVKIDVGGRTIDLPMKRADEILITPPACGGSAGIATIKLRTEAVTTGKGKGNDNDNDNDNDKSKSVEPDKVTFSMEFNNVSDFLLTNITDIDCVPKVSVLAYDKGYNNGIKISPNVPDVIAAIPIIKKSSTSTVSVPCPQNADGTSSGTNCTSTKTNHSLQAEYNINPTVFTGSPEDFKSKQNLGLLEAECQETPAMYNKSFETSFTPMTRKSWNFAGTGLETTYTDPLVSTLTFDINNATPSTASFQVRSIVGNCIITNTATLVTGFLSCDRLTFKAGRLLPLKIIGSILTNRIVFEDESVFRYGLTWSTIYQSESQPILRRVGILKSLNSTILPSAAAVPGSSFGALCNIEKLVGGKSSLNCKDSGYLSKLSLSEKIRVGEAITKFGNISGTSCSSSFRSGSMYCVGSSSGAFDNIEQVKTWMNDALTFKGLPHVNTNLSSAAATLAMGVESECEKLNVPVWQRATSPKAETDRYFCSVVRLRSLAQPFQWTQVDPDCGIFNESPTTVCKNRVINFYAVEITREIGL